MVSSDEGAKGRVDPRDLLDDPRVTTFWDDGRRVGRWYDENVTRLGRRSGQDDRVEWDAYFLYGPDGHWDDGRHPVVSWGRTVFAERARLARDVEQLLKRATSEP